MGITLRITSNTGDLSTVTSGFRILADMLEYVAPPRMKTVQWDINTQERWMSLAL